ncbi:gluzincin family metallopeptidase [Arenibaculum pallidiluteum]|uniref:hypothetical protein n=1 Tax=Arenibaculum pallidiluteum TaxID=2812559 RepID=UPI001A965D66|nr:hypothetical protein [Arenibaculum pallidiluteum]
MSRDLDDRIAATGARFLIYPQPPWVAGFEHPEEVVVSTPADRIMPGPSDGRMHVVDAEGKVPYDDDTFPPYLGPARPKAKPREGGFVHFDRSLPYQRLFEEPGFRAAHMYGVARRVLDIWEDYFGSPVEWYFRSLYPSLELIPAAEFDNAQAGFGYVEAGFVTQGDARLPFSLNFDAVAHEIGHVILMSRVGIPLPGATTAEFRAFHESAADLVAIVALLHSDGVVERVLAGSRGNLYTLNELNRIGELLENRQFRLAANTLRLSEMPAARKSLDQLTDAEVHELSQPLTGAFYDLLVGIYQMMLKERGLIGPEILERSGQSTSRAYAELEGDAPEIQAAFDAAFEGRETEFKEALLAARDVLGRCMARAWDGFGPEYVTFAGLAGRVLAAERALTGGKYADECLACFLWRDIAPAGEAVVGEREAVPTVAA